MWKCSNCDQTSTRHWNLKIHIKRKHYGMGDLVSIVDNANALSSTRHLLNTNKYSQGQNGNFPRTQFKNSVHSGGPKNSFDFIDEFYEFVHKFSTVKNFINQNSRVTQSVLPWGLPIRGASFPFFPKTEYPAISFPLKETPLKDNIVAFRGYVCKNCLAKYVTPVFWFNDTRKLVEGHHWCQNKLYLDMNLLENIQDPCWRVFQELRNVVKDWTSNKPILVSELIPIKKIGSYLNISDSNGSNWPSRAIYEGKTNLNENELSQFLLCSGIQTYNCFRITGIPDCYDGYYFFNISKQIGL